MNNLQLLHSQYQQSPWLDNLSRDIITNGKLEKYVQDGIRGITSNPTIFEHAISGTDLYDTQIKQLKDTGKSASEVYWELAKDDIQNSTAILKPIWDESNGYDGFVSLEVAPEFANDTEATIKQARELWAELHSKDGVENLMIKVPATEAGIPAILTLLSEGVNINITLLFSVERYKQVIEAYETAIQTQPGVRSVASFFVSRIDTEVDARLTDINTPEALGLRGKVAVAQAGVAYGVFKQHFDGLDKDKIQKLLWASSSTKNPDYDELLYVRNLVAPDTINTLTDATIASMLAMSNIEPNAMSQDFINSSKQTLQSLSAQNTDIEDVCHLLEEQGVQKFKDSFKSLLETIDSKTVS